MKSIITRRLKHTLFVFFLTSNVVAQNICNSNGNLMVFTNYDGGTLTINVNQNITNLKIGICSYEACVINLTGPFVTNVTEVRYAGYNNANNNNCSGGSIPTSTINGAGSASTSIVYAPTSPLANSNGYGQIICGYSCSNNTYQGGCNTIDQIEAYFLGYFTGSTLFAHRIQYGCWTGTQSVSVGGNCCSVQALLPGTVAGSQSLCSGGMPTALTSVTAASGGAGTITYTWQSSTTSQSTGFTNIPSANSPSYQPGPLGVQTWFRRASSTPSNAVVYSNVVTATVYPLPVLSVSNNGPVCVGKTISFSASGAQYYMWQHDTLWSSNPNLNVPAQMVLAGVWTLTAIDSMSCVESVTMNVVINGLPTPFLTASRMQVCEGDTVTLSGSGASAYQWEPGNLSGSPVVVTVTASTAYTLTGTDQNGCDGMSMALITVDPTVPMWFLFSDTVICAGSQATLVAANTNSATWMPGNYSSQIITVTPGASITYTVFNQSYFDCVDHGTITLHVKPSPSVTASAHRTLICLGESTTLTADGSGVLEWLPPITATTSLAKVSPTMTTTYTVKATAANSCEATASVKVTVDPCAAIEKSIHTGQLLTIMPNPSLDAFVVQAQKEMHLQVINIVGAEMAVLELSISNHFTVGVRGLPPGIYFLRTSDGILAGKATVIR